MNSFSEIDKYAFGGVSGFCVLCILILVSEFGAIIYGGDVGSLLWTTFHFVVNPILCVIYTVITVYKYLSSKRKVRFLYIACVVVALLYIFVSVSGNTAWLDILNIDFNK